jgi:hypothetical protein
MGVLCHPNFDDEAVNGVGVSADPVYGTDSTFYLNSQLGEELITNPESTYPEELLVKSYPDWEDQYSVIQYSSLVGTDSLLMTDLQIGLLRHYLSVIHDRFAVLYHAENNPTFAMDIEYKIDSNNRLVVKQARPWVSYEPVIYGPFTDHCELFLFPNPATDVLHVGCESCGPVTVRIVDMEGSLVLEETVGQTSGNGGAIAIGQLRAGVYMVSGTMGESVCRTVKLVKQ